MKNKNRYSVWLREQFEKTSPIETVRELLKVLENDQAATGLFRAVAGLGQIAGMKGDESGQKSCCAALMVLSEIREHRSTISEDFEKELGNPGSSWP